jgi:lambda family phage portal protein
MGWLDRALSTLAPGAALRRARRRQALGVLQRSYEGARTGRRTEGWVTAATSANAEIGPGLLRLRDRSRDLVRNNAWAAKAMQAITTNLVGTGIVPRARAAEPETAALADRLWSRFTATADADGLTDLYGIQALAVRAMAESGEVLVRLRERREEDPGSGPGQARLAVPLQLQLLEADHLDAGRTGDLPDGGFVLQGIEHDPLGRRRAYWLFPVHPGEVASFRRTTLQSVPVPARAVLHLFERQRPGQVRGVPWLAPVLLRLRDLDEYDDAELVRKKIEACFAAFVTGDEDGETLGAASTDARGRRVESFEPGMIEYLAPGKDVKFATPSSAGGYDSYLRVQLHAVAAGLGLTYELLTGDLSQVNYSSIRAGLLEFRRRMEALQWQLLVPGFCEPVWRRFVAVAQATGALPDGEITAEWTAPRFEAVDPLKDVQADVLAVRAGLMSLREAIARAGYDPASVLAEIAATNAELDALGLVLDSDPRKATRTGAAKLPPDTEAAAAKEDPDAD